MKKITQFKEDEATKVMELLISTKLNSDLEESFKICLEKRKFPNETLVQIENITLSILLKPAKEVLEIKNGITIISSNNSNQTQSLISSSPSKEGSLSPSVRIQRSASFDSPRKKSFNVFNLLGCISEKGEQLEEEVMIIPEKIPFKFKVFGVEIEDATKEGEPCPKLCDFLLDYLTKNKCEKVEGIFRVSGRRFLIESLQMDLDQGLELDLTKYQDIHNFSCVLKQYFRELPTPLLTYNLYQDFIKLAFYEDEQKIIEICKLLKNLSKPRLYILGKLLSLLTKISKNQQESFMTTNNLSVIFGVTLLRAQNLEAIEEMKNQHLVTKVIETMIDHFDSLKHVFEEEDGKIKIENKDQETKIQINIE